MAVNFNANTLRLMGISSGIDTDSIIQQTLKLHQLKIDSRFRSRTLLEWKQKMLSGIGDDITNFRRTYLTMLGASAMRVSSAYNTNKAEVVGKNAGAVTVTTTVNSPLGSIKIGQVERLAKNTSVSTLGTASKDGVGFKLTDKLYSLNLASGPIKFDQSDSGGSYSIVNINGADIKLYQNAGLGGVLYNYSSSEYYSKNPYLSDGVTPNPYYNGQYLKPGVDAVSNQYYWQNEFLSDGTTPNPFYGLDPDDPNNHPGNTYIGGTSTPNPYYTGEFLDPGTDSIDNPYYYTHQYLDDPANTILNPYYGFDPDHLDNDPSRPVGHSDITNADAPNPYYRGEFLHPGEDPVLNPNYGIVPDYEDGAVLSRTGINGVIQGVGGHQIVFDQTDSRGNYAIVTINGKKVQLYEDESTGAGLGQKLADKAGTIDRQFSVLGINPGKDQPALSSSYGIFQVGINGRTINLNTSMTISEMMETVNSSGVGATMRYDQFADQFTIESDTLGASNMVVWGFEALGISSGVYNNGQTARVNINGEWIERPRNDFDFRGVSITLNYETKGSGVDGAWDETDNITISIKRDVTEPLEKIKNFIDAYNTIISRLEDLIKETKNASERTYTPLTDEEKSVMSEKQIEQWEEIAKKGLLRNDSGLQGLTNSLRATLFEKVESAGLSPSQIGLTTGRYMDNTGGQIILDEEKLKAALESDPDRVMNVFMGGAESTNAAERGLLWRMDDIMTNYVNGSQFASISNLESSIKRTNEQMEKLQEKMWQAEDKLYKQFAAMETALAKIQSQADWFTAMLTSINGSK